MKPDEALVYDYRTGRFIPRVAGVVRMDRALIYIRKQLENYIREIDERKTKGLGESLWRLHEFAEEVGQISTISGDGLLAEQVNKVIYVFNERTPRYDALDMLRNLSRELEEYEPTVEDELAIKTKSSNEASEKNAQPDTAEKSSVFVIMPFRPEFNDVWKGGIQRAADDEGFKPIRVDMINRSTNITDDIVGSIDKCHLAIIDVTGNNPNVMFELGYTMAKEKPNIIISQSADFLPFDIRNIRTILYSNTWNGVEELKGKIQSFLQEYKTKQAKGRRQATKKKRSVKKATRKKKKA